jgi:protein NRD1
VSSLYVFDALSRAARHQVNKQGLTGDINSTEGNCATFLLKVEGVLEGLFQDMIMGGSLEAKVSFVLNPLMCVNGNIYSYYCGIPLAIFTS